MGLTVFYSGTLRDVNQIPLFVDEISDICDGLHWPVQLAAPTDEIPLTGMIFTPPKSEDIWFTFLPDGRLAHLSSFYTISGKVDALPGTIQLDIITQYAGPEVHMRIIELMRFLSKKYFRRFRVTDESEFWETGNVEKCRDWFAMFDVWMKNMSEDLGKLDGRGYENGESYQQRLNDLYLQGVSFYDIMKVMGDPFRERHP